MTNTLTSDAKLTADQIERILESGADYVRVTVPARKDVDSLKEIIRELDSRGCKVPVIADIHFNPVLANLSASVVSKVRINPGNFIRDKGQELLRLRNQVIELLDICKQNNTALRIGTNHGSLSDRIMNRFGDTPEGMAESAMEFLRICHEEKFRDVVVSMKASNTRIMVYATRLLLRKMHEEGMNYPLHLGVTEAGEGEDGRIRSAVGIGTLLADGIGDTIRVSLTEAPEKEIPVAKQMVSYISQWEGHADIPDFGEFPIDPYSYRKRSTQKAGIVGGNQIPLVLAKMDDLKSASDFSKIGWKQLSEGKWELDDLSPDMVFLPEWGNEISLPQNKYILVPNSGVSEAHGDENIIPLFSWDEFKASNLEGKGTIAIELYASDLDQEKIEILKAIENAFLIIDTQNRNGFADQRSAVFRLMNQNCRIPVILKRSYKEENKESLQLKSAIDLGGLFLDGFGDGIWIDNSANQSYKEGIETGFGILQASRVRVSKTEYISCPSCGRTLFDLQSTTRKIREQTSHLKGLKIGIMGCIVNGPGEMADADYGYVGTGIGKVTLYKEKEVVKKSIPASEAVDELIQLIKENGDWVDP